MAVRLIVRIDDASMAANVGGSVHTHFKSFDIEHPVLEAMLTNSRSYGHAYVVGAEALTSTQGVV